MDYLLGGNIILYAPKQTTNCANTLILIKLIRIYLTHYQ